MKFFIDTANLDEIAEAKSWGCLAGVTTNPSLYAKTGGKLADFEPHMLKIAELCEGLPVSAESTATTAEGMIEEGKRPCRPRPQHRGQAPRLRGRPRRLPRAGRCGRACQHDARFLADAGPDGRQRRCPLHQPVCRPL